MRTTGQWTREQAIEFCTKLEPIAAKYGGHVALTGGTLYRDGLRKDLDILIYRSRDEPEFKWGEFWAAINTELDVLFTADYGWCKKAKQHGKHIDFFDPHAEAGEHASGADDDSDWLNG